MSNENLRLARQVKNDEFYTRYEDIEKELIRYKDQFKDRIVYCNCDAPESNFIKFFNDVQAEWQIREVLHTSLKEGVSYDSPKALELLDKCDIVVTNPPFSKVRNEFLPLIERSGKQFLFIGNLNMATFKEVFPLIRDNKMWLGPSITSGDRKFNVPEDYPLNAAGCGIDSDGKPRKAINFDILRQMLSSDVVDGSEAYECILVMLENWEKENEIDRRG